MYYQCLTLLKHLNNLYDFYGADSGVRVARKHIFWYVKAVGGQRLWESIRGVDSSGKQYEMVSNFYSAHTEQVDRAA